MPEYGGIRCATSLESKHMAKKKNESAWGLAAETAMNVALGTAFPTIGGVILGKKIAGSIIGKNEDSPSPKEDYYEDWPTKDIEDLAQKSDATACFVLAERYAKGTKMLAKDLKKAKYWYDKTLAKSRNVDLAHLRNKNRFVTWLIDNGELDVVLHYADNLTNNIEAADLYAKIYRATIDEKYRDEAIEKYKASLTEGQLDLNSLSDRYGEAELKKEAIQIEDNYKAGIFNKLAELVPDPRQKRHFLMGALKTKSFEAKEAFKRANKEVIDCFDKAYEALDDKSTFSAINYNERQFIYFVKDINTMAGCYDENIPWVFAVDSYPKEIHIPAIGHPQVNTLYIAHPVKKGVYLPIENADSEFFQNKIDDFCRLVQCLGATEIILRSVKGKSVSEDLSKKYNVEVSGEYKGVEAGVEYRNGRGRSQKEGMERHENERIILNPTKAPYIPNDVEWLSVDSKWQQLVKNRMESDMLHYSIKISSRETMAISNSRMDAIKLALKTFAVSAQVDYSQQIEHSLQREEESEWELNVTFKSLSEFDTPNTQGVLPKNEQEYLEELKGFLEDDTEITPRERKMLERRRQFLNISKERAAELEASLKPQLTEEEQEYLDLYREYAEKGEITEKERRRLDKFAIALGLEEQRIKEIIYSL